MANSDTIPVRPDETFDENNLREYLIGKLDGASNDLLVRQFGGGKANLTYLLDYGSYQYCLLYTSPSPRDGLLSRMPSSA